MEKLYHESNDSAWRQAREKANSLTQSLATFKRALEQYADKHEELCALDLVKAHLTALKFDNVTLPFAIGWIFSFNFKERLAYLLDLTHMTCMAAEKHQIRLIIMCHSDAVFPTLCSDIIYKADELANDYSEDLNEWVKSLQTGSFENFDEWLKENKRQMTPNLSFNEETRASLELHKLN
jgi:inorganic triphosphatase YgiF